MLTGSHATLTVGGKRAAARSWQVTRVVASTLPTASRKRVAKKVAKQLRHCRNRRRWITIEPLVSLVGVSEFCRMRDEIEAYLSKSFDLYWPGAFLHKEFE